MKLRFLILIVLASVMARSTFAEVHLAGVSPGRDNTQGELTWKAKLGAHTLKVTLAGKGNFEPSVTLASAQAAKVEAKPDDTTGSIRVRTLVGASISLDGAAGESVGLNGELVMNFVSPGAHQLRISMPGKKEILQILTVEPGKETRIEAKLVDAPGSIRVRTLAGASISLDGAERGSADETGKLVLGDVPPGAHHLQLRAPGKKDYQQSVTVEPGQEAHIEVKLVDAPAIIRVLTLAGASISLDGAAGKSADASGELVLGDLPAGTHQLRISAPGKIEYQQSVTAEPGQEIRIEAKLVDVPGSIKLRTLAGAGVTLDGASRGSVDASGELVLRDVPPGAHPLQLSAPRKKEYQQSVTVTSGHETRIEVKLVDAPGSIRLQTIAGASVTLDGASHGSTDAAGELVLGDVSPGAHQLKLSAPGKKEYQQSVKVTPGEEIRVEAKLQNVPGLVRENPKDGLKYVWIPPGTFMMGCSPGDTECFDEEKPSHRVTLSKGFWIGQTEVTVAAYKRFAEATKQELPTLKPAWAGDTVPIVNMKWTDAQAYCQWAGARLLTEAEWEYAARAGSTEARYGPIDEVAWYGKNSAGQPHEVALKRANKFGLFDVLGNNWEWVNDWFDPNYYKSSPPQDPQGATSGTDRVARGGSWDIIPRVVRVTIRSSTPPDAPRTGGNSGIRCGGDVFAP